MDALGVPGFVLMQRAAAAAYAALRARWPQARSLAVFAGPGNNGGDALELARLALAEGLEVRCYFLTDPARLKGEAAEAWQSLAAAGGELVDLATFMPAEVMVDGLLGTGLSRPVAAPFDAAIARINAAAEAGAGVLALDIPSGLAADNGAVLGCAVRADLTMSFVGRKLGLYLGEGPALAGERWFDDLGTPATVYAQETPAARLLADEDVAQALPPRHRMAHKGDHGHVLCLGGNAGYSGAIRLCATAALRSGAGLVSVGTHPGSRGVVAAAQPELMVRGIDQDGDLAPLLARAGVLAVGPGLGQDEWGEALLAQARRSGLPLVLDADALNLLGPRPRLAPGTIITPHPGEAARLLDVSSAEVQGDRLGALEALVAATGAVVVLKGAGSLVGAPGETVRICAAGNPGMAVGGMGDVLTGLIAALRAQGLNALDAAAIGVQVHARAGDLAAGAQPRGLLPSDLFPHLRSLLNP